MLLLQFTIDWSNLTMNDSTLSEIPPPPVSMNRSHYRQGLGSTGRKNFENSNSSVSFTY